MYYNNNAKMNEKIFGIKETYFLIPWNEIVIYQHINYTKSTYKKKKKLCSK